MQTKIQQNSGGAISTLTLHSILTFPYRLVQRIIRTLPRIGWTLSSDERVISAEEEPIREFIENYDHERKRLEQTLGVAHHTRVRWHLFHLEEDYQDLKVRLTVPPLERRCKVPRLEKSDGEVLLEHFVALPVEIQKLILEHAIQLLVKRFYDWHMKSLERDIRKCEKRLAKRESLKQTDLLHLGYVRDYTNREYSYEDTSRRERVFLFNTFLQDLGEVCTEFALSWGFKLDKKSGRLIVQSKQIMVE